MVFETKLQKDGREVDGFAGLWLPEHECKAVSIQDRTVEFVISSQGQDRHGDVVDQKTLNLKHFEKNPVVLWSHQYGGDVAGDVPVIGLAVETKKELDRKIPRTISVAKFQPPEINKLADTVFRMLTAPERWLRSTSIGFTQNSYEDVHNPGTPEERQKLGLHPDWGRFFTNSELLEFSVVPIGANRESMRKGFVFQEAVEKGTISAAEMEMIDKAFGEVWQKLGMVERREGQLCVTQEYLEWIVGKFIKNNSATSFSVKPIDEASFLEELSKRKDEIRETVKAFFPKFEDTEIAKEIRDRAKEIARCVTDDGDIYMMPEDLAKKIFPDVQRVKSAFGTLATASASKAPLLTGKSGISINRTVREIAGKLQLSGKPGNTQDAAVPSAPKAKSNSGGYLYGGLLRDED